MRDRTSSEQTTEKEIFFAALEKATAEERAAYLDAVCGNNPVRRRRLEALLARHFEPDSFMNGPAAEASLTGPTMPGSEGPGSRIGRYQLVKQIGEGGMGVVYLAEQQEPVRRQVALKIIKLGMDTQRVVARFEAERQALALMDHPNIARVFDAGATQTGRPFFVMELVLGARITSYCDQRRLPTRARLDLFLHVCRAIQHAHQKGIIHRDVKPSNILVTENDGVATPKVIDFGIAKATRGQRLTDQTIFTEFQQFLGTPAYMSPEQAVVSSTDVDTRSDIYSLGVLLYELLTGKTPFEPDTLVREGLEEMRRTIRECEPPRPSTRLSTMLQRELQVAAEQRQADGPKLLQLVRGDLDWIVMKCLEKDRARRYETVNGLLNDIERYRNDEPVKACPPSAWYRFRKFAARNKMTLAAAGLLGLMLGLSTLISTYMAIRAKQAQSLAARRLEAETEARLTAASAQQQAVMERDQAQRRLYEARLAFAQASRRSGEAGRRYAGLQALSEAAALSQTLGMGQDEKLRLRNEVMACLALADLRLDRKWEGYPPGSTFTGIAFDRDMERYARVDAQGHITVRRLADNQETLSITDTKAPEAPGRQPDWRMTLRFSPDGRWLAASGNHQYGEAPMQVWNLIGPISILQLAPGNPWENSAFDFSPDSKVFAAGRPDGSLVLCDLSRTQQLRSVSLGQGANCLRFDPQGQRLAVALGSSVRLIDCEGRAVSNPLEHPGKVQTLCWNPAGSVLATTCHTGEGFLWDLATGRRRAIPRGPREELMGALFNQGGDLLATPQSDGMTRLRDAWTGQELLRANGLASEFSHDGSRLGLGVFGPEIGRWEVALSEEYRLLHSQSSEADVQSLSFSRDGRWLASASDSGVRLWDPSSAELVTNLLDGGSSVAFAPSSEYLLACGPKGVHRWAIPGATDAQELGQDIAEVIPRLDASWPQGACFSADGQTIAFKFAGGATVVSGWGADSRKVCSIRYPVRGLALSPDAKWLATTAVDAYQAQLWDATTGHWLRDFPGIRTADATFTPDNRWLVLATAQEYRFYDVNSWEPGLRLKRDYAGYCGVNPAFVVGKPLAAVALSAQTVKLILPEDGTELATLTAPQPAEIRSLCFSPDGDKLAVGTATGDIQVWNLRRIRQRLSALGLDWE